MSDKYTHEELKNCPFCGSKAEFEYADWDEETETGDDGTGKILCQNFDCRATMFAPYKESGYERWNNRV